MRNQPDRLTERVWQMLTVARASPMTPAEVIEQLTASLRRNVAYLARRERLHRQTAYDEALERDVEAIACAIVLLQEAVLGKTRAANRFRLAAKGQLRPYA